MGNLDWLILAGRRRRRLRCQSTARPGHTVTRKGTDNMSGTSTINRRENIKRVGSHRDHGPIVLAVLVFDCCNTLDCIHSTYSLILPFLCLSYFTYIGLYIFHGSPWPRTPIFGATRYLHAHWPVVLVACSVRLFFLFFFLYCRVRVCIVSKLHFQLSEHGETVNNIKKERIKKNRKPQRDKKKWKQKQTWFYIHLFSHSTRAALSHFTSSRRRPSALWCTYIERLLL